MSNKSDEGAALAMIGVILFIIGYFMYIYKEVTWLGTYYPYSNEGAILML